MLILRSVLSAILLVTLASAVPLLKNADAPDYGAIIREADVTDYRLPAYVKPTKYSITLTPNIVPDRFTFTGESVIDISVEATVKTITFHAKNLTIAHDTKTKLRDLNNANVTFKLKSNTHDDKKDFEILTFDKDIPKGDYQLSLSFDGILHDDLNGFYRSSYTNEKGETVWLATTQFEPTHARRAFPCFDEPAMKATFQIAINHYDNYTVRSNTLMESMTPDPGNPSKVTTKFKVTPVMSSYLVAFIVSDFKSVTSDDGKFRVWSKSGAVHTGKYAHDVGRKELAELEKYTDIKESMEKMDNFAIPQFRAGAMENWGIVTYRESALLLEDNVTTTEAKQGIATVMSHEFAHQWFGNLVSPLWWKFTWLNEGFANYFEYYITDKVESTWRVMEQFVVRNLQQTAFVADAKNDTHAMNVEVGSPKEISAIFDSISYSKAGSVIRMISHALTEPTFKQGLTSYLKVMKNKAAQSGNLFDELVKVATGVPNLRKALELWATQPGYPVLTVTVDDQKQILYVTQQRFLSKKPDAPPTEKWSIPINYVTQKGLDFSDTKPHTWLNHEVTNTSVTGVDMKKNQWVILNKKQTGYYRVNYDKANWERIGSYLHSKEYEKIDPINRAQILDDSFNLAHAGYLDYQVFLDISKYLEQEVDYVPWHAAFRAFYALKRVLTNTSKYELFRLYVLKLTETLVKNVTYTETENEEHIMKFNRNNALDWVCSMGSEECETTAHKKLTNHLLGTKISPDLRGVMLCGGLRTANESTWANTFNLFLTSKNAAERTAILKALGCSSDSTILKSYLEKIIAPKSKVPLENALKAVSGGSPAGIDIAFDFVKDNYKAIVAIDDKTEKIVSCLNDIASRMTTPTQLDKLKEFIDATPDIAEELNEKGLVEAKLNVEWFKTHEKDFETFFNAQKLVPSTENGDNSSPRISLPTLSFTVFLVLVARFASFIR